MSKVVFNLNKEAKMPHSYSMKNFYQTKEKNSFSPKDNTNFKKVTGSGIVGTSGLSPIVIYKKSTKGDENKEKYRVKRQIKNTNYISDGGLKQKIEKFNNGFGFGSSQNFIGQNKTTKNKYNKNHELFFKEKQKEKDSLPRTKKYSNIIDKKLFSKTVRESNKRPIFPKNNEKIKNCYKTKNGFGVKYKNLNEINKNQEPEDENKINEIKFKYMNQLYENGIANEIRKYQIEKKMTPKELFNEKKKILLLDNGIELENELNNIEEEENMNEEIKEEENSKNIIEPNMMKMKSPSSNNLYKSQIDFNHNALSFDNQSMSPKSKKIFKPRVKQFEFIKKIKKEQQKLSSTNNIRPNLSKKGDNNSNSYSLNDSFRHKNNQNKKKVLKNNYIKNEEKPEYAPRISDETQSTNDNYPYSHKKSHRTQEELKNFLKLKRLKEKEEKKTRDIENNKMLFVRFKNLYNLSMKDLTEETYLKIEPRPRGKMTKSKSNNNYNGNSLRRKKEVNEYYIGSEPSLKNNNSTLVDQGEYFLHILESQQLLVNSKFKKIDNISDSDSDKENSEDNNITDDNNNEDYNNNSKLNISKEQINKITDKESKRSDNSSIKTTNALNLSNYDELKQKIDNTLKRVGQVFSKENLKKLKEQNNNIESSDTSNNNNKYNINKSDNNTSLNDNIKNIKANEIIKKNNNQENPKDLKAKAHELNIDLTNVGNQIENSEVNTKEKNIPSLSHTYSTNSNPNKKVEIEIEPRAVLNLVEILKFIIQRKIFVKLYESYINHSIFQQYNIAFSYFVAICKHYPFRKIEEYANYRTYNFAFRQLFRPFTRKAFKRFINNCYMKRKIEYLVIILTRMFKLKVMEKIYLFNQFYEGDNQKAFKIIILKILTTLIKPHLRESFDIFKDKLNNIGKNNKKNLINEYKKDNLEKNNKIFLKNDDIKKEDIKKEDVKEKVIKKEFKEDFDDDDDILNNSNDKEDIKLQLSDKINIKNENTNKKNKKNDKNFFGEEKYNFDDESNSSLHRRADVSMKMYSFMHYTSENDSKNSINFELNSVDNGKLHQLINKKKRLLRNRLLYEGDDDLYGLGFDFDGLGLDDHSFESESHKSLKSLKDYISKKKKFLNKTNSDLIDDNSSKKSIKENKLNNQNFQNENIKKIKLKEEIEENKDNKKEDKKIEDNLNNSDNSIKEDEKIMKKEKEEEKPKEKEKEKPKEKEKINNNNKKESNNEEKKRNIKIEIDDIPIIKNEIHKHSTSEIDISADNDLNNEIDWEYNISTSGNKHKNKEKLIKDHNFDDDEFSLEDLDDNSNKNKKQKEPKKEINKNKNNDENEKRVKTKESKKSDEDYGSFVDLSIDDNK